MKPWERYGAQAESGPWEKYQTQEPQETQTAPSEPLNGSDEGFLPDSARSAIGGVNSLAPTIAGLPMDTTVNLANLGIAGYGMAKQGIGQALGYKPHEIDMPEPIDPSSVWLSSGWLKNKGEEAMGPVFSPASDEPLQQDIHRAASILGAGAIAPAAGVKQAAANVARMTPAVVGEYVARKTFPDSKFAPMVGMMAGPLAVSGAKVMAAKIPKVNPTEAFMKAHKLGYKVPPALAKPSKTQQAVEGAAGPVPTKQKASLHNQQVTNKLIKKDLGYPEDVPITREGLDAVRRDAGKVYEQAENFGTLSVDKAFNKDLSRIAQQGSAVSAEFPALVKKDVVDMVKSFTGRQGFSSKAAVGAIKQLRAESSAAYRSTDPSTLAMAKAQKKVADALEGLMERNIQQTSPDFLKQFRDARQRIAKTYTVEKVLKGENVDAVALGRELDKGKPISGLMRDVAEFGQNFKGAAQTNVPQQTNFRPMDYVAGGGTAIATGNPAWLAAIGARPALRSLTLSKAYQNLLARGASPAAVNKIMRMPKGEQAAAIAVMLEDLNASENR